MSWRGPVWREAGSWDGVWTARKDLGTHEFAEQPDVGQEIQIGEERYRVVEQDLGFIVVKPQLLKAH
jgi:hypothetical protein